MVTMQSLFFKIFVFILNTAMPYSLSKGGRVFRILNFFKIRRAMKWRLQIEYES